MHWNLIYARFIHPTLKNGLNLHRKKLQRQASSYAAALSSVGVNPPPSLGPDGHVILDPNNDPVYTLPASTYTSEAIFQEETDSIFANSWSYLDHASSLPSKGSYVTSKIAGEELLLVRDKKDKIRAFYNVCAHRGHRMVKPGSSGKKTLLLCPNHAWSYTLDGKLLKARKTEGQPEFDPTEFGLKEVKIENFNGLLFANLNTDADGMFAEEGGLGMALKEEMQTQILDMSHMELAATVEKEVETNWKCLVDNFLECYHCDTAHRDFVDMVDMSQYQTNVQPRHVYNYSPCKPENSAYSFSPDDPCRAIHYYWLWPNTVIYSAPGPANMSVLQFIPISANRSLRRAQRFFAHKDITSARADAEVESTESSEVENVENEDKRKREAAVAYLNEVLLEEDTMLCESIQQGMKSRGYKQGRFVISPTGGWETEAAVAQFHALVHSHLCT